MAPPTGNKGDGRTAHDKIATPLTVMMSITLFLVLGLSLTASSAPTDNTCECGIENISARIIRGRGVSHGSRYPWMVYLQMIVFDRESYQMGMASCTGSVINDRYILTAAHCLQKDPVRVGAFVGRHCKEGKMVNFDESLKIKGYVIHDKYRDAGSFYDIALIELSEPLKFNQSFSPVCFPNFFGYDNFLAAGWGQSDGRHPFFGTPIKKETDCLREADLDVVHPRTCRRYHPYLDDSSDKAFCAGGRTNVCQGDSGGPLMTRKDGNMYQVGITSFGRADCGIVTETPAVFEKVSAHYNWIKSKTRNARWCKSSKSMKF